MSRAYIYFAKADGNLDICAEYKNAWGFGAFVFEALSQKYKERFGHVKVDREMGFLSHRAQLWTWVREDSLKLPAFELNTLVANYDGAYVQGAKDIAVLADSFELFAKRYAVGDRIQHLTKMASALREAIGMGVEYVCFYPMSVSEDHWQVVDDEGSGESHRFRFGDPSDAEKVEHNRYIMAPVDGPDVCLGDVIGDDE